MSKYIKILFVLSAKSTNNYIKLKHNKVFQSIDNHYSLTKIQKYVL